MNDYGFGGVDGRDMAIRELEDRKAAYKQRIAELEAQVTRLQDAVRALNEQMGDETGNPYSEAEVIATYGLCPGDLDPVGGQGDERSTYPGAVYVGGSEIRPIKDFVQGGQNDGE